MGLDAISKTFGDYIDSSSGLVKTRDVQKNIQDFVNRYISADPSTRVKIVAKMEESALNLMATIMAEKVKTISNPVELEKFFKAYIDTVGLKYKGLEKIFGLMREIARGIQGEANPQKVEIFLNRLSLLSRVFNDAVEKVIGHRPAPQTAATSAKGTEFERIQLSISQVKATEEEAIVEEIGLGQPIQIKLGKVDIATLEGARKLLLAIQQKLSPQQLAMFIDELTTGKITVDTFLRLAKEEELKKKFKTKDKLLAKVLESAIEEIGRSDKEGQGKEES